MSICIVTPKNEVYVGNVHYASVYNLFPIPVDIQDRIMLAYCTDPHSNTFIKKILIVCLNTIYEVKINHKGSQILIKNLKKYKFASNLSYDFCNRVSNRISLPSYALSVKTCAGSQVFTEYCGEQVPKIIHDRSLARLFINIPTLIMPGDDFFDVSYCEDDLLSSYSIRYCNRFAGIIYYICAEPGKLNEQSYKVQIHNAQIITFDPEKVIYRKNDQLMILFWSAGFDVQDINHLDSPEITNLISPSTNAN